MNIVKRFIKWYRKTLQMYRNIYWEEHRPKQNRHERRRNQALNRRARIHK